MAQQMLKHKVTGELFVYTPLLAKLPELELVREDPVEVALKEIAAETAIKAAAAPVAPVVDEFAAALAAPTKKQRKANPLGL